MDNRLSENIKRIRIEHGYKSQQTFADALGVHFKSVQGWENGSRLPDLDSLIRISDLLDVDLDYLTGRLDKPTHDLQFISDQTGLSPEAIKTLQKRKETETPAILSRIINHRLFVQLMRMIDRLSHWQTFNRMFSDSVIHHLTEDGIYIDSPDDLRAIYENQTTTIFHDIVKETIK